MPLLLYYLSKDKIKHNFNPLDIGIFQFPNDSQHAFSITYN